MSKIRRAMHRSRSQSFQRGPRGGGRSSPGRPTAKPAPPPNSGPQAQFGELTASSLYCPQCRTATQVRERLLLVLPDGNLYDYRCGVCGTSTGTRTTRQSGPGVGR